MTALLVKYTDPVLGTRYLLTDDVQLSLAESAHPATVPYIYPGAPVSGTSGTLAGVAVPGAMLIDTLNLNLYQNTDTEASPTWTLLGGATGGAGVATANSQAQPSAPTAPASTAAYKMQGIAGALTPVRTGAMLIMISGDLIGSTTTAGDGIKMQLSYGTGTAPSNAGALAGTQVGSILEYTNPAAVTAADINAPFSMQAIVTGLTIGTAIWVDIAAESVATASAVGLSNLSVTLMEI